jgi:hypothetical protein
MWPPQSAGSAIRWQTLCALRQRSSTRRSPLRTRHRSLRRHSLRLHLLHPRPIGHPPSVTTTPSSEIVPLGRRVRRVRRVRLTTTPSSEIAPLSPRMTCGRSQWQGPRRRRGLLQWQGPRRRWRLRSQMHIASATHFRAPCRAQASLGSKKHHGSSRICASSDHLPQQQLDRRPRQQLDPCPRRRLGARPPRRLR